MSKKKTPERATTPEALEIERRAACVLERAYRGLHRVRYWDRRTVSERSVTVSVPGEISTYDWDVLTRLVIAAHDGAVRVDISPGGPGLLRLVLSPRERTGGITWSHPTMEQAIETTRADEWWL